MNGDEGASQHVGAGRANQPQHAAEELYGYGHSTSNIPQVPTVCKGLDGQFAAIQHLSHLEPGPDPDAAKLGGEIDFVVVLSEIQKLLGEAEEKYVPPGVICRTTPASATSPPLVAGW